MRRTIILLSLLVLAAATGYILLRAPSSVAETANSGEVVTVSRATIVTEVVASGAVEAEREVNLTFKVPGRIVAVHVNEGERVAEGQLLAALDTSELELQLRQAETALALAEGQLARAMAPPAPEDLAAARSAVASAVAAYERLLEGPTAEQLTIAAVQIKKAEIALQQAQSAYDQVKWVGGIGALQPSLALQAATLDYEAAKANYELQVREPEDKDLKALSAQIAQARAQLARLEKGPSEEDLAILRTQIQQARIGVDQVHLQLGNALLRAPFDGLVARVFAAEGQLAGTGLPVLTLLDCSRYHITLQVDEGDLGLVAPGQPATVELDSYPGVVLQGHVQTVGLLPLSQEGTASSLLGGGGVVQFPVRVDVDEDFPGLRAGMTTQVTIQAAVHEDVLVVPNRAVRVDRDTGVTYVDKLVDGDVVSMEVILGASGDGVTEILAGVEEGDQILLPSGSGLEELRRLFGPPGGQG